MPEQLSVCGRGATEPTQRPSGSAVEQMSGRAGGRMRPKKARTCSISPSKGDRAAADLAREAEDAGAAAAAKVAGATRRMRSRDDRVAALRGDIDIPFRAGGGPRGGRAGVALNRPIKRKKVSQTVNKGDVN